MGQLFADWPTQVVEGPAWRVWRVHDPPWPAPPSATSLRCEMGRLSWPHLPPHTQTDICLAADDHLQRLVKLGKRSMDRSTTRSYDEIPVSSKALVPMRSAQPLQELLGWRSGRKPYP